MWNASALEVFTMLALIKLMRIIITRSRGHSISQLVNLKALFLDCRSFLFGFWDADTRKQLAPLLPFSHLAGPQNHLWGVSPVTVTSIIHFMRVRQWCPWRYCSSIVWDSRSLHTAGLFTAVRWLQSIQVSSLRKLDVSLCANSKI